MAAKVLSGFRQTKKLRESQQMVLGYGDRVDIEAWMRDRVECAVRSKNWQVRGQQLAPAPNNIGCLSFQQTKGAHTGWGCALLPEYAIEPGPEDLYPACPNRADFRDQWAAFELPKIEVPMARGHSEIFEIPEAVASSKDGRPLLHSVNSCRFSISPQWQSR